MSTSTNHINQNRIVNKRSADPFDKLIFEKGLRVKQVMADKKLNTMIILLNNSDALKVPIDYFAGLKDASQNALDKWELTGNGVGLRWSDLDEDVSLKGLISNRLLQPSYIV